MTKCTCVFNPSGERFEKCAFCKVETAKKRLKKSLEMGRNKFNKRESKLLTKKLNPRVTKKDLKTMKEITNDIKEVSSNLTRIKKKFKLGPTSFLVASLVFIPACGMNNREAACTASVDMVENAELIQCRKDNGGKCPEAEINRIMDANDEASRDCIRDN